MQNPLYLAEPMGPVSLPIAAYMRVNGTSFRVVAGRIPDHGVIGHFGYHPLF